MKDVLVEENARLRARVDQLERAFGLRFDVPLCLGLSKTEAKIIGILMKRDYATREACVAAIWSSRNIHVDKNVINVHVCNARSKLVAFGIEIETIWGSGYRLSSAGKTKLSELLEMEITAAGARLQIPERIAAGSETARSG